MTNNSAKRIVDADHPWLGLSPFTSATKEYFFGRDREIRDLFLRVRDQPLTILYGKSGLGKTSLLGAGLIPKLQVEGYRPCSVRLGFEPIDPSAIAQTSAALRFFIDRKEMPHLHLSPEFARPGYEGTMLAPSSSYFQPQLTLWELFHNLAKRPEDIKANPIVLILDQFEEIFTLANGPERQREVQEFFCQLSDLIENRPPQTVQDQLRQNRRLTRDYDLNTSPMRVVITLREDYLSQLESWKKLMPSMMRNRVGLQELAGPQALDAVVQPGQREGRQLVSNEVGASIVRFVAQRSSETPLEEIGAVPPLLSLICDELNESRIAASESTITAEQVSRQSGNILETFYTRSFDGLPDSVRRYVEDRMVTIGGYRNPVASEDAISELAMQGVEAPQQAIDQLMFGRLLSSEERGGVQRLEITHDVLAPLVVRSRDARRNREKLEKAEREREVARRQRKRLQMVVASMIGLAVFALVGAGVAIRATMQANRATLHANQQEEIARKTEQIAIKESMLAEKARESADFEASKARVAESNAKVQEQLAITRLEEQTEQAKEASKVLFAYGFAEYEAGRPDSGVDKLMRARALRVDHDPVKQSYEPVIVDRLTRGNRSWAAMHHQGVVMHVAFSPDGSRIATASSDKTARIWDALTGAPLGKPMKHDETVTCVAFSPDGSRIATASIDNTARIWDAQTGAPLGEPMKHQNVVMCVAFSPNGRRIATASFDKTARIWDAQTGAPLGEPMKHEGGVRCVAFSPDGSRIATASSDKTARIWDAQTGALLGDQMKHEDEVNCVAFSPDGSRIGTASNQKTAHIWDAQTGAPLGEPMKHEHEVNLVAFSPDGSRIATTSEDKTARIWDSQTGVLLGAPMKHDAEVMYVAFSPDGSQIATASGKTARIWGSQTGKPLEEPMKFGDSVSSVAFSRDGSRIATASGDNTARIWDALTGAPLGEPMKLGDIVSSVAFSPDCSRIVTASGDNTARIWDAQTGVQLGEPMQHVGGVDYVAFSPDGSRIATASGETARLWDAQTGAPLGEWMKLGDHVIRVVFSPDGSRIAASHDKTARIWDAQSGATLGEPMKHESPIMCVAFSPDDSGIFTASMDMTARIWDSQTGKPVGEPIKELVALFAFSLDGSRIATASIFNTVCIWDAKTGAPLGEPMKHENDLRHVAFSADSRRIRTASKDGKVRTWDAERLLPKNPQDAINHFLAEKDPSSPRDFEFDDYLRKFVARKQFLYRSSTVIQSLAKKNWFTAKFHLPWLCEQEPNNPRWKKLLDETNAESLEPDK